MIANQTIGHKLDVLFPIKCYLCGRRVLRTKAGPRLICPNVRCKASQNDHIAHTALRYKERKRP